MIRRLYNLFIDDWYRFSIIAVGAVCLITLLLISFRPPLSLWVIGLLIVLFSSLDALVPLQLLGQELSFGQVVILGSALLYGPWIAILTGISGVLFGSAVRNWFASSHPNRSAFTHAFYRPISWLESAYSIAQVTAALWLATLFSERLLPLSTAGKTGKLGWQPMVGMIVVFALLHTAMVLGGYGLRRLSTVKNLLSDLVMLVVLEFLPLPFILVVVLAYPQVEMGSIVALGAFSFTLALLMSAVVSLRIDLERKVDELNALNRISQALHSTLELDNLLAGLQLQVRQLLTVDNFYVALYDGQVGELWYPVAVKHGQLVHWRPRPLMDRLTDRVIRKGQPILLPHHAQLELERIGLPVGEDAPCAWMGVPLISARRVTGCLAVFSFSQTRIFTSADLNLLLTIAAQAGVAIENAMLHKKTEQSASQIENVTRIAALAAGSLRPEEVLDLVCRSAVENGGGDQSAIFLMEPENGQITLASSWRISTALLSFLQSEDLIVTRRTRCLSNGKLDYVPDVAVASDWLDPEYLHALQQEDIQAFVDIPLVTPEGLMGYLSVYYCSHFTPERRQISLLQTLAAQAALSVSSARLHAASKQALALHSGQLTILESIGRNLATPDSSPALLKQILEHAINFTNSNWGRLALCDPQSQILNFEVWRDYPNEVTSLPLGKGVCGRAILQKQTLNIADVRNEPEYLDFTNGQARSHLSIPLLHKDEALGVLTLESSSSGAYTGNQLSFASQLANQAVIALINARLYRSIAEGGERLSAVINSVSEGLLMIGLDGRVVLANPFVQKLLGLSSEQLVGAYLPSLAEEILSVIGLTALEASRLVETFNQGEELTLPALKFIHGEFTLERSLTPVRAADGDLMGWMALWRDISAYQ